MNRQDARASVPMATRTLRDAATRFASIKPSGPGGGIWITADYRDVLVQIMRKIAEHMEDLVEPN